LNLEQTVTLPGCSSQLAERYFITKQMIFKVYIYKYIKIFTKFSYKCRYMFFLVGTNGVK